jgi:poly-gamma-glutamate synthesis protein (capsule biosynthesis protein)
MNGEKANSKIIILGIASTIIVAIAIFYVSTSPKTIVLEKEAHKRVVLKEEISSVRILVVGDMMLDRNVRRIIDRDGFDSFFAGVKDLVEEFDISVANLEGPFTVHPSKTLNPRSTVLQFTFDPVLATELSDFGFDILGLANNHTLNFGKDGLESTRRYIGDAGMGYYGDPNNLNEISTVIDKNGVKVGFVGFHEFSYMNFDKVFAEIQNLRPQVDVLIVTPHWGIEYKNQPTDKQRKWAREFIDSGADMVIGTHPHVIQTIEEYDGKKIYYSLGNFAFDQYFSKETMTGMGVQLEVRKDGNNIEIDHAQVTFEINGRGVKLATSTTSFKP